MSELTLSPVASRPARRAVGGTLVTMAWRNLWRVPRRTWLTAGGVAFAILFVVFLRSMHAGAFGAAINLVTERMSGHVQVQHPEYLDDPRMRHTVEGLSAVTEALAGHPDVRAVAPRGIGFALVSAESESEERSFGAQVLGIDPAVEFATVSQRALPGGRALERAGEGFLGSVLARNLGAEVGDSVLLLGTGREGGVAAIAVTLVGIFESGVADLDRSVMMVHLDDFAGAFGLEDEAHVVAVLGQDAADAQAFAASIARSIESIESVESAASAGAARVLPWQEIQPQLAQLVVVKDTIGFTLAGMLTVIVTFVVVSAFVMTVFDRTAEFGMLKAIGMPPAAIFRMVQFEGLWMSLLGVALGLAAALAVVSAVAAVGVPVSEFGDLAGMYKRLNLPDTLIPAFATRDALLIAGVMIAVVQFAAAVPAPRIWRLSAVDALRDEE
ncbi:MAG: ABC transporter permease [Gammaproteobacteria bacterium]|nr:ABC transporter permease [Gammaproteobacteria bacterium]